MESFREYINTNSTRKQVTVYVFHRYFIGLWRYDIFTDCIIVIFYFINGLKDTHASNDYDFDNVWMKMNE